MTNHQTDIRINVLKVKCTYCYQAVLSCFVLYSRSSNSSSSRKNIFGKSPWCLTTVITAAASIISIFSSSCSSGSSRSTCIFTISILYCSYERACASAEVYRQPDTKYNGGIVALSQVHVKFSPLT